GEDPAVYRDEVFARLEKMCDYARANGVWCCHENEKGIYGDIDDRCLDILTTLNGKIKGIFDPANFIQCHVEILPAYEKLKDYIEYMHVKDCRMADGFVVPCGKGDGHLEELLRRFSKKDGKRFLTLEPHLKVFDGLKDLELTGGAESVKEEFEYPTNRDAFNAACDAFHAVLAKALA
ncbi:MAG: sugar phosphate isomerase/epimerase, partial [Clostridia bacterium]|nr:sugar phosphate isomerase/epimerase [Clostridia bacterium]